MVVAACASLSFMCMGNVRGWSSPGMPSLIGSGAVSLSPDDISWISSVPPLASIFGSLAAGPCLTLLGRKKTLILIAPIYSVSFLLIGFATEAWMLYVGRIVGGLMIGISTPSTQIFIGECASPRVRGALGSFPAIFLSFGILSAYIVGSFVEWNVLAWILAGFPASLLVAMLFMPETPAWLLANGREEQARKSLQFLRGSHTDVSAEFERIKSNVSQGNSAKEAIGWRDLLRGPVLKPLLLSMGLMLLQQFSGINAIIYFTVSIFNESGSSMEDHVSSMVVGAVQMAATVASMFLVDRAGRRVLLLLSGFFMAVSLAALGAFFYLKNAAATPADQQQLVDSLGWLPLASLILFIIAYLFGYANVPFLIMAEIFPTKYRSLLGALSSSFNLACTFTIVFSFNYMRLPDALNLHGTFFFYMSFCAAGVVYVYFLVPETKGKSFEEIELMFGGRPDLQNKSPAAQVKRKDAVWTTTQGQSQAHTNETYQVDDSDDETDDGQVVPTPV